MVKLSVGSRVLSRSLRGTGTVIDVQRARDGSVASVRVRWDGMNPAPVWYLPGEINPTEDANYCYCGEPHPDYPGHDLRTCVHCEALCRPPRLA